MSRDGITVDRQGEPGRKALQDAVEIVDYDPTWPALYAAEARRLREALPVGLGFTLAHIGSTAVPGLAAKPVIDMMLTLDDTTAWRLLIEPLRGLAFIHWADNPRRDRMFFVKGMPPFGLRRSHHLHVRVSGDGVAELRFRDYLRRHADEAARYAVLKRALAAANAADREAYTEGKSGFVEKACAAAEEGQRP